jgi:hypothetical protein
MVEIQITLMQRTFSSMMFAATVVSLMLASGCGKGAANHSDGKPITVKGLRLGMDTNELTAAAQDSLAGYSVSWQAKSKSLLWDGPAPDGKFTMDNWIVAEFDDAGHAKKIWFSAMASEQVFNSGNLTHGQFVEAFTKAYGIPEMQSGKEYAEAIGKDGTSVRVSRKKEVIIQKGGDTKPNFN